MSFTIIPLDFGSAFDFLVSSGRANTELWLAFVYVGSIAETVVTTAVVN